MKTDVWYFDPIWAAKAYNPEVDINNFEEVRECARHFTESLNYYTGSSSGNTEMFYRKRTGVKEKTRNERFYSFNLISEDGKSIEEEIAGTMIFFKQKGIQYAQIGPYTINVDKTYDTASAFKAHNIEAKTKQVDELEYLM
jgi:hypothetical protein